MKLWGLGYNELGRWEDTLGPEAGKVELGPIIWFL